MQTRNQILAMFDSMDTPTLVEMLGGQGIQVDWDPEEALGLSPDISEDLEGWGEKVLVVGPDNRPPLYTKSKIREEDQLEQGDTQPQPYMADDYDMTTDIIPAMANTGNL